MGNKPPNIVLVTTDQQRHDTLGPKAPPFLRTPHLNLLAHEGVTFSAAYADCPICIPSRISIMTGRHVFSHGASSNARTSDVMGRTETLPALLNQAGYQTAAIGKMHFHPMRARHGFQEMILPDDYYRWIHQSGLPYQPMRHGLGQTELYPSMSTVPESLTLTSWITEQCVEYIRERHDPTVPFFLWCSYSKPHPPFDPPEPYYSMYRDSPIPDPIFGNWSADDQSPEAFKRFRQQKSDDLIPHEIIREARAAYYGLITQIDYNIGRLISALNDVKLLEDTLIIFTSDHGEYLGDHHAGSKVFFHEPSAHVPLLLRMPKQWDNRCHGQVVDSIATMADLLPTVLTAAGGQVPDYVDGQDLIGIAQGGLEHPRQYLLAMSSQYSDCDYLAITDGKWKYIWYPEGPVEQLFDLNTDPYELNNVAEDPSQLARRSALREELINRLAEMNSPFVEDGELVHWPAQEEPIVDRRNQIRWAFHTDYHSSEYRH
jgi:arylsulfatase